MGGRAVFTCVGFFAPFCSPYPLRCSAQALGFGVLGFALALVCFGSVWGVTMHFCAWFFCFCSVVVFSFLFLGSHDSRGRGEDTWIWSGPLVRLAGGSPGFFNPVRLVCFGAFSAPFFLRCFVWGFVCLRVCLRLLRTRCLSAFCTRFHTPPLGWACAFFS